MDYELAIMTESGTETPIAINPHFVRLMTQIDEKRVLISFDNTMQVVVDGKVKALADYFRTLVNG